MKIKYLQWNQNGKEADMKNPLNKRYFRELKNDFGKYIALCLFLIVTIGFCSGFLVADGSTKGAYDESFEKYNIEDGHFILAKEADSNLIDKLEEENLSIGQLFYKDVDRKNNHTIRLYKNRMMKLQLTDFMEKIIIL